MLTALKRYATPPPSALAGRLSLQSLIFASARRHVPGRLGGVLHPRRRPVPGPGRHRPHHRRDRELRGRGAHGQAGRPLRPQAHVGAQRRRSRARCSWLAVHRQLPGVRRPGGGHGGRRARWAGRPTAPTSSTSSLRRSGSSRAPTCTPRSTSASASAPSSAPGPSPSAPTSLRCWALPCCSAVRVPGQRAAILRLPDASHDVRSSEPRVKPEGIRRDPQPRLDRGDRLHGSAVDQPGAAAHVVIPLWLVTETDAPKVLVAILFGTNTRHVHRAPPAGVARHPRHQHGAARGPALHRSSSCSPA